MLRPINISFFTTTYYDGQKDVRQKYKVPLDDHFYSISGFKDHRGHSVNLSCRADDGGPYRPILDISMFDYYATKSAITAKVDVDFTKRSLLTEPVSVTKAFSDESRATADFEDLKFINFSGIKNTGVAPHFVQAIGVKYEEYTSPLSFDPEDRSKLILNAPVSRGSWDSKVLLTEADSQENAQIKMNCMIDLYFVLKDDFPRVVFRPMLNAYCLKIQCIRPR